MYRELRSTYCDNCWRDILEDGELWLQLEEAASAKGIWKCRVGHKEMVLGQLSAIAKKVAVYIGKCAHLKSLRSR